MLCPYVFLDGVVGILPRLPTRRQFHDPLFKLLHCRGRFFLKIGDDGGELVFGQGPKLLDDGPLGLGAARKVVGRAGLGKGENVLFEAVVAPLSLKLSSNKGGGDPSARGPAPQKASDKENGNGKGGLQRHQECLRHDKPTMCHTFCTYLVALEAVGLAAVDERRETAHVVPRAEGLAVL